MDTRTQKSRIGLILVNLGTPDAPTPKAVRRYLAEFLADRRVVELPPFLWKPVLHGIILRTRPRRSAEAYQQVWTHGGSPLAVITAEQANQMQQRLGDSVQVDWAMRYGRPDLRYKMVGLQASGCDRLLIAPLYPQYSAATSGSAMDAMGSALAKLRSQPAIRVLPPYYDDPLYIDALAKELTRQIGLLDFEPQVLLLSFHGMPERTERLGDPYRKQCLETVELLIPTIAALLPGLRVEVSFQSRFGPGSWLKPYTDIVLENEARSAAGKRLVIAAPGFAADCLETREELAIRGREAFMSAGGERFAALDCLNAGPAGMAMLEALCRRELAGWL
ncbi:MAG: ferrochelatase [Pseudomonas sp.]|uniref:ferrochelatase n=1 Tax=Pseudomonas sp. TaxID=306 RepID=UPI00121B4BC1|nr:ferrochelatase [Pseudomonas sp.]RZI74707.1 MAG: ferrochelatase [Pseudomonas sp.]